MAQAEKGTPPSVVTSPPRHFGPNAPPSVYVFDPDIVIVDPLFTQYVQGNTPIKRLWTGALWSEGPGLERPRPLSRGDRMDPRGQADRPDSSTGEHSQSVLRRPKARPAFMAASQSLYAVNVRTQGAAPGWPTPAELRIPTIGIFHGMSPFCAFRR
jgi:hypothetical protein